MTPESSVLGEQLGELLAGGTAELRRRWRESTRSGAEVATAATADRAEDDGGMGRIVEALVDAVRGHARWHDEIMRAGWAFGIGAHHSGLPLHFVIEELDLLVAMLLHRIQEAAESIASGNGASGEPVRPSDALRLARSLHDAGSLLRLSATKGYTQSVVDELRGRFRTIRHDLRNPLGTITSALALMEDESLPEATRTSPRFRAMAKKNAKSLEAKIRATLADSAAMLPAFSHEAVSLRAIACTVRRDLRGEAEKRQVRIVVGDGLPTVPTDSAGFELVLKSVVLAVMRDVAPSADVVIDAKCVTDRAATVRVSVTPDESAMAPLDEDDLAFARELAARTGGRVWPCERREVCVEVPTLSLEQPQDVGAAGQ